MTFKDTVIQAVESVLEERSVLFLIDLKIDDSNKINLVLDGDQGVNLQDCIFVSRAVEAKLDSEELEFSIEVASSGVSSPLLLKRQYVKNIGRQLKVKTITSETLEGKLVSATDEEIVLEWSAREPKKVGKGKETVQKSLNLRYEEIKEATVIISF
jgi:ribosome maturation factor RimP